jgi:hypothetical protein
MISRAREQTLSTFNNAAINRAVAPIGKKIEGTGTAAVKEAGDILSAYYDDALSKLKGVKFDARFDADLMQLKHMTRNLVPQMRRKFDTTLDDIVEHRLSPNRSMIADTFSKVESELKSKASDYLGSSTASERELGAALKQLQNILHEQMIRTNPHIAQKIRAADAGWANLVRIEKAAEAAKNKEGVFTPAQLNSSIRSADSSVRHRATARGTALMQDLGSAGQTIIGSKYPDSGTPGRIAAGLGLLGAGAGTAAFSPATALGVGSIVGTGSLMYTRPVQNMLVRAVANRPSGSNSMANLIRELSPYGAAAFAPMALE